MSSMQGGGVPPSGEPAPFALARQTGYVPRDEEQRAAMWAHFFGAIASLIFASLAVPILAPLIAMAMNQNRGPFFLYHLNQAAAFQAVMSLVQIVLTMVVGFLAFVTCGVGAILGVVLVIPPLLGAIYPFIVGLRASQGGWDEYPIIGEKVLNARSPVFK
jgi:uncharacterized Tic20 family protein